MSARIDKSWVVFDSIEEFRRDSEDAGLWTRSIISQAKRLPARTTRSVLRSRRWRGSPTRYAIAECDESPARIAFDSGCCQACAAS
jgi:hypothetical protein